MVELKNKNGEYMSSPEFNCSYDASYYLYFPYYPFKCVISIWTIRKSFNLTERSDSLNFQVRRTNSDRGSSVPLPFLRNELMTAPILPKKPLVKISATTTSVVL